MSIYGNNWWAPDWKPPQCGRCGRRVHWDDGICPSPTPTPLEQPLPDDGGRT